MAELLLDSNIRSWVFLPVVVITLLVGILRHYVSILFESEKEVELQQVQDSQVLIRADRLCTNGMFIPWVPFLMRKEFFNNRETGYFNASRPPTVPSIPIADPNLLTEMMKGNITNVLPMILIGGWINWTFSGFVSTKVPFPLTLQFKPMLQRGIELQSLDAAWVSSASWYFLNVFGLRSIYSLVLGENNSADQSSIMQAQLTGAAKAVPPDPKAAFKAEWESLELFNYKWALKSIESNVMNFLT